MMPHLTTTIKLYPTHTLIYTFPPTVQAPKTSPCPLPLPPACFLLITCSPQPAMVRRDCSRDPHVRPQHSHPPQQHIQHNGSMSFTSISKNMLFNGGGSSSRGSSIKYAVIGLLVGLVVGMQLILLHVSRRPAGYFILNYGSHSRT